MSAGLRELLERNPNEATFTVNADTLRALLADRAELAALREALTNLCEPCCGAKAGSHYSTCNRPTPPEASDAP